MPHCDDARYSSSRMLSDFLMLISCTYMCNFKALYLHLLQGVAEIENLLLTEPFVTAMAKRLLYNDPVAAFCEIRDYVIEQRFKAQLDKQIIAATISALKAALAGVDVTPTSDDPLDNGT